MNSATYRNHLCHPHNRNHQPLVKNSCQVEFQKALCLRGIDVMDFRQLLIDQLMHDDLEGEIVENFMGKVIKENEKDIRKLIEAAIQQYDKGSR